MATPLESHAPTSPRKRWAARFGLPVEVVDSLIGDGVDFARITAEGLLAALVERRRAARATRRRKPSGRLHTTVRSGGSLAGVLGAPGR